MRHLGLAAALALLAGSASAQPLGTEPSAVWPADQAEAAGYPYNVPYGGHLPGGYEGRIGRPYYWSVPGSTTSLANYGVGQAGAPVGFGGYGGSAGGDCPCNRGNGDVHSSGYGPVPATGNTLAVSGRPAAGPTADPYTYHFGPGFYRAGEFGHYRFPYYSYRRPWYDVGHPVYVRDTNLPW